MARPTNSDVFRALAHPVRRELLTMLRERDMSSGQLAAAFKVSQPTISIHLRTLRECGLVTYKARGNSHVYSLVRQGMRPLTAWLSGFKTS